MSPVSYKQVQVARQSRRCRRCSHWEEVMTHQSRIMKQSLDLSVMWVLTAVRQCLGGACWALAWCWDRLRPFDSDDVWEYVDRMILYVMVSVCDKTNHFNSCDVIYHDPALSQQLFSRWVNTGKAWAKILRLLLRSQLTSWLAHVCSNWVTVYVSRGLTSLYIYSFLARGFVLCLGRMAQLLQELATERPEHTFWRKVLDTSVSEAERQSEPQIHDDSCIICRPNRQMVFRISTFLFEIESQGPFWRKPRDMPRKLIKSSNSSGRGHQHRSRIVLAWCPGLAAL